MISYKTQESCQKLTKFFEKTDPQELYYDLLKLGSLNTHKNAILKLLSDNLPHEALEVQKVGGLQYNARIYELRGFGFSIENLRLNDSTFFKLNNKIVV